MNIKQASEQSGVSAPNIRFYEKEGLLTPARRQGNDYRDYTAGDVRTLKLIRMLRMLDVPLPTIKAVLRGEQPLQQALQAQQTVLEQQAAQLAAAMQFCADLARQAPQTDTLNVDACLTRMESPAHQQGFFSGWLQDYCTLAKVQHQKHFFFIPQGSINTPQEFTAALQAYAEEKEMQFTLTKEGMYRSFCWTTSRISLPQPGKYRDEICCDAVHPEQLDAGLPLRREKLLRFLRLAVPPVCTFAAILAAGWVVTGGAGWLWLAVLASAGYCWDAALKNGCKVHYPSGSASATVKKV